MPHFTAVNNYVNTKPEDFSFMPYMFLKISNKINISNAASHHEIAPSLCKRRGECLLLKNKSQSKSDGRQQIIVK